MSKIRDAINALSTMRSSGDDKRKPQMEPLSQRVTCEAAGCRQESRVLSRHSGLSICLWHYEHEFQEQAREYSAAHDLRTIKDHIEHCKENARGFGELWTRERLIEQWRMVLDGRWAERTKIARPYIATEMSTRALEYLRAEPAREPGEEG